MVPLPTLPLGQPVSAFHSHARAALCLPACPPSCPPVQHLEELDSVMAAERLGMEAMRQRFIDDYAKKVAENVAAGLGPPPGHPPAAAAAATPAADAAAPAGAAATVGAAAAPATATGSAQ